VPDLPSLGPTMPGPVSSIKRDSTPPGSRPSLAPVPCGPVPCGPDAWLHLTDRPRMILDTP
jgi:hypothetical protein